MSQNKTITLLATVICLLYPAKLMAQILSLPNNYNGNSVTPDKLPIVDDILRKNPATLYQTVDGLIIGDYKVNTERDGSIKVEMDVYNPMPITGQLKVYNSDGSLDRESSIDSRPMPGKNIVDQGKKMVDEFFSAAKGENGNFLDVLKYSALDPRANIPSQKIPVILKPGQTLELTNKDSDNLLLQKVEAVYDLVLAIGEVKSGMIVDDNAKKSFLEYFKKKLSKEGRDNLGKELSKSIISDNVNLIEYIKSGKPLINLIDKSALEKIMVIIKDSGPKATEISKNSAYDTLTGVLSEGTKAALEAIGAPGVGIASDWVYNGANVLMPIIKLKAMDGLGKLPKLPGLMIANNSGSVFYPTNIGQIPRPSNTYPTDLIQNNITSITQGSSSHIGSASYYLGKSPNQDPKIELEGVKLKSAQETEQYTTPAGSITNLKAPVDVVLNWNQSVAAGQLDLDSHLTGPTSLGDDISVRFHTYYSSKGSSTTAPYVLLYRDVIPPSGSGAEQTRIQVLQNGVYRFYVHDFTNREITSSTALSQSGANVNVYNFGKDIPTEGQNLGTPLGNQINVPTNQQGNVWRAFELDSRTGVLKPVINAPFGNVSAPASVPTVGQNAVTSGGTVGK